MDNQKIGLFIASLRKEKSLTQRELADKLRITDRAISKWERGKGCPDISLLDDLSKALDISVLEILKGKRLAKDELIENKELIETMTFTKANLLSKIKKDSSIVAIVIFIFVISLLLFYNLKSFYFFNKTYKNTYTEHIDFTIFDNIDERINLILNNQGKYTDEEYEIIMNYIKGIQLSDDIDDTIKFFKKKEYSYKELISFTPVNYLYELTGFNFSLESPVYKILVNYDINKLDNMLIFNKKISLALEMINRLNLGTYGLYNTDISEYDITYQFDLVKIKYTSYDLILDDIIEVGEIHE